MFKAMIEKKSREAAGSRNAGRTVRAKSSTAQRKRVTVKKSMAGVAKKVVASVLENFAGTQS